MDPGVQKRLAVPSRRRTVPPRVDIAFQRKLYLDLLVSYTVVYTVVWTYTVVVDTAKMRYCLDLRLIDLRLRPHIQATQRLAAGDAKVAEP